MVLDLDDSKEQRATLEETMGSLEAEKTEQNQSRLRKTIAAVVYHFYYIAIFLMFAVTFYYNHTALAST